MSFTDMCWYTIEQTKSFMEKVESDRQTIERFNMCTRIDLGDAFFRAMVGQRRGLEDLYELIYAIQDAEARFQD